MGERDGRARAHTHTEREKDTYARARARAHTQNWLSLCIDGLQECARWFPELIRCGLTLIAHCRVFDLQSQSIDDSALLEQDGAAVGDFS